MAIRKASSRDHGNRYFDRYWRLEMVEPAPSFLDHRQTKDIIAGGIRSDDVRGVVRVRPGLKGRLYDRAQAMFDNGRASGAIDPPVRQKTGPGLRRRHDAVTIVLD